MKVYELLEKPESWTQFAVARDEKRIPCAVMVERACSWCLMGAIIKCYPTNKVMGIADKLFDNNILDPSAWNDSSKRTHAEVINLCKELDI